MKPDRMIPLLGLLLLQWGSHEAAAGPVTLQPAEVLTLRSLVGNDGEAKARFGELQKEANAALDDKPNPLARVLTASERLKASDDDKDRMESSVEDIEKIYALAWSATVTQDQKYSAKAREFIVAWATTNQSDGHAINESRFEPVIEAYDLLRTSFPAADQARVDGWLRKKAELVWADPRGRHENWQSHRVKIVGLVAGTLNDTKLWQVASTGYRDQIAQNYNNQGESVDFKHRDALQYHIYGVEPLLTLACVAKREGESLYDFKAANGSSLSKAVDFVKPFAFGEKSHVEFLHSTEAIDRKRAAAGEKTYAPHPWQPKGSVRMYSKAGCVDPKYEQLALEVDNTPAKRFVDWRAVLNASMSERQRK